MNILILFGPPYSGKGTQGERLAKLIDYAHISTGDLLRQEKEANTALGILAQEYSRKGLLVPDEFLEKLVDQVMQAHLSSRGIILDGYPRTIPQAETLARLCQKYQVQLQKVIFLQVDTQELVARGIERGLTSNREDDRNPAVIQKRIAVYHSETQPVAEFYANLNLVVSLPGQGNMDEITERIIETITSA
jgi:adenylate kinase